MSKENMLAVLLLSAIALAILIGWLVQDQRTQMAQVLRSHRAFLRSLEEARYSKAYGLMNAEYRRTHTLAEFRDRIGYFEGSPAIDWKCGLVIAGRCTVYEDNSRGWTVGRSYEYVREGKDWRFTGEGEYFAD